MTNASSQNDFTHKCNAKGIKVTPQRALIYKILSESKLHPSAEQVYKDLTEFFPNASLDTVYRTLKTFADAGIVECVESFGPPARYDANTASHHHIHCINCGKILDIDKSELGEFDVPQSFIKKYCIQRKRLLLEGICLPCQKDAPAENLP
ncbi:Fur family transcriptional regulator [Anaerohalosphaera lusitana]|nr:transcriptional repressor [Anaerohalosphaera lusitana]